MSRIRYRDMAINRRQMLRGAGVGLTGAGAALLFGCGGNDDEAAPSPSVPGEEPPPEVTSITLPKLPSGCQAPLLAAEEFLYDEGFTDVRYQIYEHKYDFIMGALESGAIDIGMMFAGDLAYAVDQGVPAMMIGGAHVGCFELRAAERVKTFDDLRGGRIAIPSRDPSEGDYAFVSSVLQYIGLAPGVDVELTNFGPGQGFGALEAGRFDGIFIYPPQLLSMQDANEGHVMLDSKTDARWSQSLCCLVVTNEEFFNRYPVATKRALRAILKGVDHCVQEPEVMARRLWEEAWAPTEAYALRSLQMIDYNTWRPYDPEDALRFYALLLNEAGLIGSTPDEIIAKATDWTFFNELKQEMAFAPGTSPLRAGLLNCDTNVAGPLAWAPDVGRKRARGARS